MRYRILALAITGVAFALTGATLLVSAQETRGTTDQAEIDRKSAELEEARRARRTASDPREQAIDDLVKQLESNPDDAELHYKLGNAYHDAGYLHSAFQHFDKSVALESGWSKTWVNRGVVLKELNRREEAMESFEKALEIDPNDPLAHVNLGDEYLWQKLYQQAVDSYRTALELNERCAPAYYSLAIAFAETGMYRDAARAWRKCAEIAEEVEGPDSETFKRATENAKLMEDIIEDAQKQLEEREKVKRELEAKGKSD
jgi:tetratricopeptide (TPR) repeat protein